jgi:uncharacterized protein (TIGR03435 family)
MPIRVTASGKIVWCKGLQMRTVSAIQVGRIGVAIAAVVLLTVSATIAQAASLTDLTGSWQGTLDAGASGNSKGQRIVLKVTKVDLPAGGTGRVSWRGVEYSIDDAYRGYEGRNTTAMSFEGGEVRFAIAPIEVKYEGKLSAEGTSIAGQWTQGGQTRPLMLVRADGDAAWTIPEEVKAMAKDADPDWEVVTVRKGDPNQMNSGIDVHGRDVVVERKTAETLLLAGYGVHETQLVNEPDWVRSELWDAKGFADVPGQPGLQQFQSLIRKLLVERFGLVSHTAKRDLAVYSLTVGKGALKIEKSGGDPNGLPNESDSENGGQRTMQFSNITMREFCLIMTSFLERPMVDKTGIEGRYDFRLKYTFDEMRVPTDGSAPATIITAIQEQLGLKLEPVKMATDVMVIDKVERPGVN